MRLSVGEDTLVLLRVCWGSTRRALVVDFWTGRVYTCSEPVSLQEVPSAQTRRPLHYCLNLLLMLVAVGRQQI